MSTVTIANLVNSIPALKSLNEMPLRPVVAMRVVKTTRWVESELADYDAARVKLAGECSVLGEDGKPKVENNAYVLSDPAKFQAGMAALLGEPCELPPSVKLIPISHFDAPLTPALLTALDWLIVEAD